MKAWHVQEKDGSNQEIVFAKTRTEAIQKSEAIGWSDYIDIRAKRAKYADGLNDDTSKLLEVQLENGWWIECKNCHKQVTNEDKYIIEKDAVYCEVCSGLGLHLSTGQRLKKHMDENGEAFYSKFAK